MVYLSPRPPESESWRYYQHEEYLPFSSAQEGGSLTEQVYKAVRKVNLRWKRKLIEHYWRGGTAKGAGRLLDVGCGTGEFLEAVRRGGWQVDGLERDEKASTWARENYGLSVRTGNVQDIPGDAGPFDVITMWHVVEHLYDPAGVVRRLLSLLEKDGFLLIAVPNIGGIDAMVYGANWIALDTPRHVNHFTADTLTRLLTDAGFTSISRRQLPFDPFFNTLMSEELGRKRSRSSHFTLPFRFLRAGLVSLCSLAGGSRLLSGRYGATLVFLFGRE
jgi:2-polyprenyl-3-methyl-5-hydroxy-6-metoxy-1,4-benzoquinol methylase